MSATEEKRSADGIEALDVNAESLDIAGAMQDLNEFLASEDDAVQWTVVAAHAAQVQWHARRIKEYAIARANA